MALRDRIRDAVEERVGLTFVPTGELDTLKESLHQFEQFAEEANELAYWAMDYFSGRPQQLRPEKRARLAQRSRIALTEDPLAGAEADLLSNFAFGKGVGMPDAEDEDVQQVIEEAWTDSNNEQKLTGFEATRHRSNQLITAANLYPTAFIRNGKVRLAFLEPDRVREIICDPEDDERPLWYVYEELPEPRYSFTEDRWLLPGEGDYRSGHRTPPGFGTDERGSNPLGIGRLVYYPHWRNVEDVQRERQENGEPPLELPPVEKLGKGLVEHIRINRIGATQFGTPPWARTLRFYSAMNQLTEAHVSMAQAASTFIAKRVMKGSPETITRSANAILAQTGELGAARFGTGEPPEDLVRSGAVPPPAGSFWLENEQHRLESLQLNSGAAQAAQTATIVRAPIAAASGFGQHYLGDASNANLATATSLELPTQMTVHAWQATFEQLYRWFVDITIQAAVRTGRLGGERNVLPEDRPLNELMVREADERLEAERRTGKSLKYKFAMPYPGRRNLPDVTSSIAAVASGFDMGGNNVPLRRALLLFYATHGLEVEDPRAWVDEVLPEEVGDAIARMALQQTGVEQDDAEIARREREQGLAKGDAELERQQVETKQLKQGDPTVSPKNGDVPKRARGITREGLLAAELGDIFEAEVMDPILALNGKAS